MSERIDDLLRSWELHLEAADKAPRTIELYRMSVTMFARWLAEHGRPETIDEITRHAVVAWLADMRDRGIGGNTLLTRHKQLGRFCKWLVAEGELPADPVAGLELPKPRPKPVPILADTEVMALLKVTAGTQFADRRDHAILRVLFDCGLRISEVARLGVADVDLRERELTVNGKGRKVRVVPFCSKTGVALDRYLRERRSHRYAELPALFLTQRGGMSRDGIDDLLRVRAGQAGVDGLHAHRFRHTFAHNWLTAGGEGRDLMRLAGWSSDAMLEVYGRAGAEQRARDAFRRLKLGDRL